MNGSSSDLPQDSTSDGSTQGDASRHDSSHRDMPHTPPPALATEDAEAVDLLIEHALDLDAAVRARPALAPRLRAAAQLFGRLDSYPTEAPDAALVEATLARIAQSDSEREARMRFEAHRAEPPRSTQALARWRDLVALSAAAILILSIGMPIASWLQGRRADAECGNNMRTLATGISTYVGDHRSVPIAAGFSPDLSGLRDWHQYRGAQHLQHLAANGYCDKSCTCCGNDSSGEGYAYQTPSRLASWAWNGGTRVPAVADRNPIIDLTRRQRVVGSYSINSPEHGGRGQNILFTDGSVVFERSPILIVPDLAPEGHPFATQAHLRLENIWLPLDNADAGNIEDGLAEPAHWTGIDIFLIQ